MRLDDGDAPSTSSKRRTLPVDFVELKQRYMSVVPTNERVLLDIRERVTKRRGASWTSSPRGDDDAGAQVVEFDEREDRLNARSVLGALRWIQGTMKATDWTRLRARDVHWRASTPSPS